MTKLTVNTWAWTPTLKTKQILLIAPSHISVHQQASHPGQIHCKPQRDIHRYNTNAATLGWPLPVPPSLFGAGGVGSLGGVARVQGFLGGAAVHVHVVVGPGGDVAQRWGAAVGQGGDLCRLQHPIPQVELGKLPHQGLGGIEVPAQCILGERRKKTKGWMSEWRDQALLGLSTTVMYQLFFHRRNFFNQRN